MLLNNILFISEETLKTQSLINMNVDNKLLTSPIKLSQVKYILPVLGTALYEEIQTQISANTVTSLNQTLLNYYIQPALIYYSAGEALPFIHLQFRNGGVNKLIGETIQPADIKEINMLVSSLMDSAQYHAQRMIGYLKQNKASYPLYTNWGSEREDGIEPDTTQYDSGMFLPNKNNKC